MAPSVVSHVERPSDAPEQVARSLVELLPTLHRLIVGALHEAPHTAGMHLAQFRVLARLSERDYRAAELAAVLEVGRPSLTVTANSLVRRGLVERLRAVPEDRRGVLLRLTPAGGALFRAIESRAISAVAGVLEGAAHADRSALALGLAGLRRGLQDAGHGPLRRAAEPPLLELAE
jgi:DNA-binding MarR family transcriptional regulator